MQTNEHDFISRENGWTNLISLSGGLRIAPSVSSSAEAAYKEIEGTFILAKRIS